MCNCNNCMCGEIGFRFKPSDEELILHYLRNKVIGRDHRAIAEIDLCKFEPWELPSQSAVKSEDRFWYFIYLLDKKYPGSQLIKRSTKAGYWKITGQDRPITESDTKERIGTKKTLVFCVGRVPKGVKTPWIIHEYHEYRSPAESDPNEREYVVGRLERKPVVKKLTSQEVELGSSSVSTSHSKAAEPEAEAEDDVAVTEGLLCLQEGQEPFSGNNYMGYEGVPLISMQEQGISLEDLPKLDDCCKEPPNGMLEKDSLGDNIWHDGFVFEETEGQNQFDTIDLEELGISDWDAYFYEEMFDTHLHDYTPSMSMAEVGINDTRETETEMVNMQNQPFISNGHWNNQLESDFDYEKVRELDSSGDGSAAATSYELNSRELVQGDSPMNARYCESRYQPRSHNSLAEKAPLQLQCGNLGKEAPFGDKASDIEIPKSPFSYKRKRERGETLSDGNFI